MLTLERIHYLFKKRVQRLGGYENFAKKYDIPAPTVHGVYYGLRNPGTRILDIMGIEKVTIYRYKNKGRSKKEGQFGTIYGEADE